jgi:hypothetical protein
MDLLLRHFLPFIGAAILPPLITYLYKQPIQPIENITPPPVNMIVTPTISPQEPTITPSPTLNPTPTIEQSATPRHTNTSTMTPQPTRTPTITSTINPLLTPSSTIIPSPIRTPTATSTPVPTSTPTPTNTIIVVPVTSTQLDEWFTKYSTQFSVDRQRLWNIAVCESSLNPNAKNGDYGGMYQFSSSTWRSTRQRLNVDTNIQLRFNAEESIKTAAFLLSTSGHSPWPSCSK